MQTSNNDHFASLNDYFDHIYVLTLDRARDRQDNIRRVLNGLDWRFFQATDKNDFSEQLIQSQNIYDDAAHRSTKRTHRSMNLGEVACAISHRRMYQDMLDNGYKRVLIMEDDVLPQPDRLRDFSEVVAELPDDWEVLMLGYYGEKPPSLPYKAQQAVYKTFHQLKLFNWHHVNRNWIDNICMRSYSNSLYQIGKVLGTHAYAVTDNAARKFIDYQTPVKLQADRIFNYYASEHSLKAFAPKRTMFTLSELSKESSIQ